MNTSTLAECIKADRRRGFTIVAEQLGLALRSDASLDTLGRVLTGFTSDDPFVMGMRAALLEVVSSAVARQMNIDRMNSIGDFNE